MITVMEVWHIKPSFQDKVLDVMQKMDDMLGPPAHQDLGWCGHARFYQSVASPTKVLMIYPWRSRELHEALVEREEPLLRDFLAEHCTAAREIHYYNELPVEVEHGHEQDYARGRK